MAAGLETLDAEIHHVGHVRAAELPFLARLLTGGDDHGHQDPGDHECKGSGSLIHSHRTPAIFSLTICRSVRLDPYCLASRRSFGFSPLMAASIISLGDRKSVV